MKDITKDLMKTAIYAKLAKKALKAVRGRIEDIDIDKDYWLHKIGLTTYRPSRVGGGIGLFVIGAVAGGVIGLALAPKAGAELRSDMKEKLDSWRNQQVATSTTADTQLRA